MIRIAICDNDILELQKIYGLVREYAQIHSGTDFEIRRFHSVFDLLECLENPDRWFNIYIFYIIMPIYNGIELGQFIRKSDEDAVIIYVTTSSDYALDSFSAMPLNYLLKPLHSDVFFQNMDRVVRQLQESQGNTVLIKHRDGILHVFMHQIEHVEYQNHMLIFHLRSGERIESRVMRESFSSYIERTLDDRRFIKPHAAFAVNMDCVQEITNTAFQMTSGTRIPISKRVYPHVKKIYLSYVIHKNGGSLS